MNLLEKAVDVINNMGASSLLPLTVVFLCLCFGVKPGKAIRSGLMIGAGFRSAFLLRSLLRCIREIFSAH